MTVYEEIHDERVIQDKKWGGAGNDDTHSHVDWIAYIVKHGGRAVRHPLDLALFRKQMIRIGALAVAAVEWSDRRPQVIEKAERFNRGDYS